MRGDGVTEVVHERRLVRVVLEQPRSLRVFQLLCELEGARIEHCRLGVGSELRRTIPRSTSELEHSVGIAGLDRMASKCCRIASSTRQGAERAPVKTRPLVQRQRLVDRLLGELVAEAHNLPLDLEHAACDALRDRFGVTRSDLSQQRELGRMPKHGGSVQDALRAAGESSTTCEHGVTNRRWNVVTPGSDELRDVERIPARRPVHVHGIQTRCFRHLRYRVERQRRHTNLRDERRRHVPESASQRVRGHHFVVSIRRNDEDGQVPEAPPHDPEQIEGRLVGPMNVLQDDDRR